MAKILHILQIMPGLKGDLEEWQTQEVNVTPGIAEGDIELDGLPCEAISTHHVYVPLASCDI